MPDPLPAYGPSDDDALIAAARAWPYPLAQRAELLTTLKPALAARAASIASLAALDRLCAHDGVAIVTGQQPAHGGGPLYTLVKAAHAITVAARLRTAGVNAQAVFWSASEDHDHGEAGHADLIKRDGRIQRLQRSFAQPRASLHHQDATDGWHQLIQTLHDLNGGDLGGDFLLSLAPHDDEDLGNWHCRLLDALFAKHGLICIQAHEIRPLATAAITRAVATWPAPALAKQASTLTAAGHACPLGPLASPPLFADRRTGRTALSPDMARELLAEDPLILSPGAGLRPVIQQAVLPTLAYCAGPGEIAYHAQLPPLFASLDLPPPRLITRASCTLLPGHITRALASWQISAEQLIAGHQPSPEPDPDLAQLDRALADLAAHSASKPPLAAGLARLQRERDRLARSLARAQRGHRRPLGEIRAWLLPREQRQERCLSLAQAVWQSGPGLADALIDTVSTSQAGSHHFLSL
ncbi:MAG: bacillithiol biosynthesis protein BshC [Planctomycetota bacterium]|jgi:uncharacterized protein YllA (UPF0747 family)